MISAKAYILRERRLIPSLEPMKVDDNLLQGQVLIRLFCAGLCATQMEEIFSASRNGKCMPHVLGQKAFGRVEAVGPGVRSLRP